VPAFVNRTDADWPCAMSPVSNAPPVAVAVCATESEFVHVTRSPTLMVRDDGENVNPEMATARVAATAAAPPTRNIVARAATVATSDRVRRWARADSMPPIVHVPDGRDWADRLRPGLTSASGGQPTPGCPQPDDTRDGNHKEPDQRAVS
jgi:hypothetical protein